DFFITTTGNFHVITTEHLAGMKDKAVVGNVGHFDNEIDVAGLARVPGVTRTEIKPQVHEWTCPATAEGGEHSIIVLSAGDRQICDCFITTTANLHVITTEHLAGMKDKAVVGNVGHFDNEIDVAGLARVPGVTRTEIKPQVHEWTFPATAEGGEHSIIVLSEGRLLNLGNATGHPSFVMSNSFANQVIAQMELFARDYDLDVHRLPKVLDEKVARLHLEALGVELSELTKEQADYIDVDVAGP